ncbi:hypothetical protein FACS1894217_01100 [Clostridia bacterium]|nr:hypothetical protein FACS1894217_01100 [Clostridia bacterium]
MGGIGVPDTSRTELFGQIYDEIAAALVRFKEDYKEKVSKQRGGAKYSAFNVNSKDLERAVNATCEVREYMRKNVDNRDGVCWDPHKLAAAVTQGIMEVKPLRWENEEKHEASPLNEIFAMSVAEQILLWYEIARNPDLREDKHLVYLENAKQDIAKTLQWQLCGLGDFGSRSTSSAGQYAVRDSFRRMLVHLRLADTKREIAWVLAHEYFYMDYISEQYVKKHIKEYLRKKYAP